MIIKRTLANKLKQMAKSFPAVAVLGPRQSGKTTLVKKSFPKKPYVLLEDPDTQEFAQKDPRAFLSNYPKGAILDEIQRVPHIFSYLQGILDKENKPGLFILTGSQNFLLMEKVTQSLAGRIALLTLLPFSMNELTSAGISFRSFEDYLTNGFYPRIYDRKIKPYDLYSNYVQTYLERDIRLLKNVHDLSVFHTFLKMCAHRSGQLLNYSSISNDCGITHNTTKSWISLLETSYVIFLLRPHHKNFNKRLVKMPKLYFYDTGLAVYLAGIQGKEHLLNHPLRGPLFETLVISELIKHDVNNGKQPNIFFWRDKLGREIDCLIEKEDKLFPIEIKSGKTVADDYFKNIIYFNSISGNRPESATVVYGGDQKQKRNIANLISWKNIKDLSSL